MRDQRVRDPIHNLIKFSQGDPDDRVLWELIQTAPFQRLRRIRQLGFTELVYPGASHTRLSHSLGAMQMARRMLQVFQRNAVIQQTPEFPLWRRATLCAALLHDIGHGPYSHAFEEVSEALEIVLSHEHYTLKIIRETEIAEVLRRHGTELLDTTISFFDVEPGENPYSRIVSSQLDADRLDFLVRDRYYTGIKFGAIDLEWIFDSLDIQEMYTELGSSVKQFGFIVKSKGLTAIEEFLASYSHMYSKVYFHKTTRSAQYMVMDIMMELFSNAKIRSNIPDIFDLYQYFTAAPEPDLKAYLRLDDNSIVNVVKWASSVQLGEASHLARRFLNRDLYKCFEIPKRPNEAIPGQKVNRFLDLLRDKNFFFHLDRLPLKGYKQFDIADKEFLNNILVIDAMTGEPTPIKTLCPSVDYFAEQSPVRLYFRMDADREAASDLWQQA